MKYVFVIALIVLAALSRILPHPANFTLIGSLALFLPALFPGKRGILLAPLALFLSDLIIGFYSTPLMLAVYGSFILAGLLGILISKDPSPQRIALGALSGAVFFYLVTNAAVWFLSPWYPQTLAGLMSSYVAGLPFLRNQLLADTVFSFALYGALAMARKRSTVPLASPPVPISSG